MADKKDDLLQPDTAPVDETKADSAVGRMMEGRGFARAGLFKGGDMAGHLYKDPDGLRTFLVRTDVTDNGAEYVLERISGSTKFPDTFESLKSDWEALTPTEFQAWLDEQYPVKEK